MIQIKRAPLQPHPASAPSPRGHGGFGPRTQGMGVAVLTLSAWLLNQRETTSRAQWGGGGGTVSKHRGRAKNPQ